MWKNIQPPEIRYGLNSAQNFKYPTNSLIITSKNAISRGWIDYLKIKDNYIYDDVEPNPSVDNIEKINLEFGQVDFSCVIGIGGGSSIDVAKFFAFKNKKMKIMIPTTFGTGSEVTRISVLNVNGKKTSFHDDHILSDVAIIDPFFLKNTPFELVKNSAIDSCAQCSEAFDSKLANIFTKFLCDDAFQILEDALIAKNYMNLPYGAMLSGLGFGNSSTTLGHALSYVYSNEGYSHGHALAFTTTIAHKYNESKFYKKFKQLVAKLNFEPISLKQDFEEAAKIIMTDRKHLDYNPKPISKEIIIDLLTKIDNKHIDDI